MHSRSLILAVIIVLSLANVLPGTGDAIDRSLLNQASMPEAGKWYVSTTGNDSNSCASAALPCATIQAAINKAAAGDTVYVQSGRYFTGSVGQFVILVDKNITVSGGWNSTFKIQIGVSRVDGENVRPCVKVNETHQATLSHLMLENGSGYHGGYIAGGIINQNQGVVLVDHSIIRHNYPRGIDNPTGGSIALVDSRVEWNGIAPGGAGISNDGSLTLLRSAVTHNDANWAGGGIASSGSMLLINSTVADNTAPIAGGIWANGDSRVYNSTITHNSATQQTGGVYLEPGMPFYMRNSILAENDEAVVVAPDCYGSLTSGGHNLIGDTTGCTYVPSTGDVLDQSPVTMHLNSFYALLPASPAIDAANPGGCLDDQDQPLLVDQRGSLRPVDGDGDNTAVCDIGSYEYNPASPHRMSFLPLTANPCPTLYRDDFSDPLSGWPVADDSNLFIGYAAGEYRILLRNSNWYVMVRPGFKAANYEASVDIRNVSGLMGSYGLAFGIQPDWSGLYTMELYPDGWFGLYRYDANGYAILAEAFSPYILQGTATNHIRVRNVNNTITVFANGKQLANVYDPTYSGELYLGLASFSYVDPNLDIRFDNFLVMPSDCNSTELPQTNPDDWQPGWMENSFSGIEGAVQQEKHKP